MADTTTDTAVAPPRRSGFIAGIVGLHNTVFGAVEKITAGWFTGLAVRFTFASVLFWYYVHSGTQKLGEGIFGFLNPTLGAYASILPKQFEAAGYDTAAVAFFPWYLIVVAGTWAEIILPVLIVVGLFSRIAALGMIAVVFVQSYVDIVGHGLDEPSIGAMFDRLSDALIYDQRLLWVTILAILVVQGPGRVSLDHLLGRFFKA